MCASFAHTLQITKVVYFFYMERIILFFYSTEILTIHMCGGIEDFISFGVEMEY